MEQSSGAASASETEMDDTAAAQPYQRAGLMAQLESQVHDYQSTAVILSGYAVHVAKKGLGCEAVVEHH